MRAQVKGALLNALWPLGSPERRRIFVLQTEARLALPDLTAAANPVAAANGGSLQGRDGLAVLGVGRAPLAGRSSPSRETLIRRSSRFTMRNRSTDRGGKYLKGASRWDIRTSFGCLAASPSSWS